MASGCSPSHPGIRLGLNNRISLPSHLVGQEQNFGVGMFLKHPGDMNEQPGWRFPTATHPSSHSPAAVSKTQISCHLQERESQALPLGYQLLHHPTPSSPSCPISFHSPLHSSHWLRSSCAKQATSFNFRAQTLPFAWNASPTWSASHSYLEIFLTIKAQHHGYPYLKGFPHAPHSINCFLMIVEANTSIVLSTG